METKVVVPRGCKRLLAEAAAHGDALQAEPGGGSGEAEGARGRGRRTRAAVPAAAPPPQGYLCWPNGRPARVRGHLVYPKQLERLRQVWYKPNGKADELLGQDLTTIGRRAEFWPLPDSQTGRSGAATSNDSTALCRLLEWGHTLHVKGEVEPPDSVRTRLEPDIVKDGGTFVFQVNGEDYAVCKTLEEARETRRNLEARLEENVAKMAWVCGDFAAAAPASAPTRRIAPVPITAVEALLSRGRLR